MAIKIKKNLTPPLFRFVEGTPLFVKMTSEMYLGKEDKTKEPLKKKEPAMCVNVINLETGQEGVILIGAVVKSVLIESYPNSSYIDKSFSIMKKAKALGKEYFAYEVMEIEWTPEVAPVAVAVADIKEGRAVATKK